jgi:predicted ATPase/DNA-binding SARP family transcriptional activator
MAELGALDVGVLGPLEVRSGPARIGIPGRRLKALLGLFALRAERPVTVEQLVDATWEEGKAPPTAARTIRSQVAHLRRALRDHDANAADALRPHPPGYVLGIPKTAVDGFRFESMVAAGRDAIRSGAYTTAAAELDCALALWRGDVLSGCGLYGWARAEATRLAESRLTAAEDRLEIEVRLGGYRAAAKELEYLVACHPYRERVWELLMVALYADSRRADALAAYQKVRKVLGDELGVDPGPRLTELEMLVLRNGPLPDGLPDPPATLGTGGAGTGRAGTGRAGSGHSPSGHSPSGHPPPRHQGGGDPDAPVRPAGGPAGRVPAPVTRLIDREMETKAVVDLVDRHRLVTLSGFGGCGKTRLAIAVSDALPERRFGRIVFVDLTAITDATTVASSIAAAFGVPLHTHQPLADVMAPHLARETALLVLDNCEHLVVECATLVEALLTACPALHVLATSREALGTVGELVYAVPPLPVPSADEVCDAQDLAAYAGVKLFAERANISDVAALPAADVRGLTTLCAGLEGLPLSLELAAARARVLSLPQLAELLSDRFRLLSAGSRTGRPQHRSLRACVEWSHDLIGPDEQALFRALSVFPGTFDLPAVTALGAVPPAAVLDLIHRLATKSLIAVEHRARSTRYRMLDTIRQYAAELLAADRTARTTYHRRHAEYYRRLAVELDAALRGPRLDRVLDRLTADHDNMRAAMSWLTGEGADPAGAVRLAGALWQFCYLGGHYQEGRGWLTAALDLADAAGPAAVPVPVHAGAVDGAAALAAYECDYAAATALAEHGLTLYTRLGDRRGMARALTRLGSVSRERGEYERALERHRGAMALFEEAGDDWGAGHSLQLLGFACWLSGDVAAAHDWSTRALSALTAVGDKERIAWTLVDLGAVACYQGDHGLAFTHGEVALRLFREVNFKEGIAWAENLLGLVDVHTGELSRALDRLATSAALHTRLGDHWRLASVTEVLAYAATLLDSPAICADLLRLAESIRAAIGAPVPACERPLVERTRRWLGAGPRHAAPPGTAPPGTAVRLDDHITALQARAAATA